MFVLVYFFIRSGKLNVKYWGEYGETSSPSGATLYRTRMDAETEVLNNDIVGFIALSVGSNF